MLYNMGDFMNTLVAPLSFVLIAAVITSLGLAGYTLRRASPLGITFAVLCLVETVWSLTYLREIVHFGPNAKWFLFQLKYLTAAPVATLLFIFILQFIGQPFWRRPRNLLLLSIKPVITLLVIWNNPQNHLYISGLDLIVSGSLPALIFRPEIGFQLNLLYDLLLTLCTIFLLADHYVQSPVFRRKQIVFLMVGIGIPWLGALKSFADFPLFQNIDTTPLLFFISLILLAFGAFRYRLFDLIPVAHEVVLQSMDDGIIVLDPQDRVLDLNPAARVILNNSGEYIGKSIDEILAQWPDMRDVLKNKQVNHSEVAIEKNGSQLFYEVRKSPLQVRAGQTGGYLVILRDITEYSQLEGALRQSELKYRSVVEHGNDGIAILLEGSIRYCNPQLASMLGLSARSVDWRSIYQNLFSRS